MTDKIGCVDKLVQTGQINRQTVVLLSWLQVSLLDDQLVDKGRTAQNHVEELVLLRTELAQEKASLAIVKQEIRDQAAREVGVAKTTHERQVKGLEAELKKANVERGKMDANIKEVKTRLKGEEKLCLLRVLGLY